MYRSDTNSGMNDRVGHVQVSDFDNMMMKRREWSTRGRQKRKDDTDIIYDNDAIDKLLADMRHAAAEDRRLNLMKKPATNKTNMLPMVMRQLNKRGLQVYFLEHNVLSVLTDWLAPMPDSSMPSLKIRESILTLLLQLEGITREALKISGIGKAMMYLYKHPDETKNNKKRARELINQWAHLVLNAPPIDFKAMIKNMVQRDLEQMPKMMCTSDERQDKSDSNKVSTSGEADGKPLRPGDNGWMVKARFPRTFNKVDAVPSERKHEMNIRKPKTMWMLRCEEETKNYKDNNA